MRWPVLIVGWGAVSMLPVVGFAEQPTALLVTAISGEGYSEAGQVHVFQAGTPIGATARWSPDSIIVNKFRLRPSTYELEFGGKTLEVDLSRAGVERVLDLKVVTQATGSYNVTWKMIAGLSFEEAWRRERVLSATYQVEDVEHDLEIQLIPVHPLVVLGRLSSAQQDDVLSALHNSESVPTEPYILRVKDMRPPPARPREEGDESRD